MYKVLKNILLLLLLSLQIAFTQNINQFHVEKIAVSDLPLDNTIRLLAQDSVGFIWMGYFGLKRYDGQEFIQYKHDPNNKKSISDENIIDLHLDSKKRLWVAVQGGLDRYIYTKDHFKHYWFTDEKGDTLPYNIFSLAEDTSGNLYAGLNLFEKNYNPKDGRYRLSQSTGKGVYQLDVDNEKFIALDYVNNVLDTLYRQDFLESTNQSGIYETTIVFPSGHFNNTLRYRFSIFRKNGTIDQEPFSADNTGNRIVRLTHNRIELPLIRFNEEMETSKIKYTEGQSKNHNTEIRFRIDLTNLEKQLEEGDEIHIFGNLSPLAWFGRQSGYLKRIAFDCDNRLWLGNFPAGIFRFDLQKKSYSQVIFKPQASEINGNSFFIYQSNQINDLLIARNGDVWIATWGGLHRYIPGQDTMISYYNNPAEDDGPFYNETLSLTEDATGNIWIGNHKETVTVFNQGTEQFYQIEENILPTKYACLIDKSGTIWLGGDNQGVNKIITNRPDFESHYVSYTGEIFTIFENTAGTVWLGGENGLFKYNRKTKQRESVDSFIKKDNPLTGFVTKFYEDKNRIVWLSAYNGLFYIDPLTKQLKHFIIEPEADSERIDYLNDLCKVSGIFWSTSERGFLYRIDPATKKYKSYQFGSIMYRLTADKAGNLWFIGEKGLVKFNPGTEQFEIIDKNGVGINLLIDINGTIWYSGGGNWHLGGKIYNYGEGLNAYNPLTKEIIRITEEDGLLSALIMGLELDDAGNIWISSKRGLSRYNPITKSFKHYYAESGLKTDDFRHWAEYKNNKGEIFFITGDGFVVFHPDSLDKHNYTCNVILKELKINNETVNTAAHADINQSIFTLKELQLAYDQNDLSFSFASLDFTFPEKNMYSFMLENDDDDWRQESRENKAYYTNLDPGEYIFKVKGSNSYGVWNENPWELKITILPPWWATWWAYSFYVVFIITGLYFGRRYELNRQRLKHNLELEHMEAEKLKEVDTLKSRFFASISHEFRTPLTLIRGPVERLLKQISNNKQKTDLKRIKDNAARMNKLVEMYLDLSRLESGNLQLQKEESDIIPSLKSVIASFESMAQAAGIKLQFTTTIGSAICLVDREKFELILINLLSNAIKFTPEEGTIHSTVEALTDRKELLIRVSDNGIGISEDQLGYIFDMYYQVDNEINSRISGTGIGLTMVKELVEMHDGRIAVASNAGKGTTFTITLPFISYSESAAVSKATAIAKSPEYIKSESTTLPEQEPLDKEKILIVEDNHQMREYIQSHLENDYQTVMANNGKQGFKSAVKNNLTLIISDVMMPEMDGYEFCAKIKSDLRTSHIPVILLTAKAEEQDMLNGLQKGADTYLKKPFKADELLVRIKNLIDNRKRLHQKFQTDQHTDLKEFNITSADEVFLNECLQIIEKNLANSDFSVEEFAQAMALSRSQLFRKIKALTGLSANKYILTIRLKKSMSLLSAHSANISQIAYDCGFSNPSYFAEAFREMYGVSPTEYQKKI